MDGTIQVDLTARDEAYARRKFIAHKGWKTRIVTAITRSSNLLSQSYHWDTLQTLKKDMIALNKHMDAIRHIAQWLEDEGMDVDHKYMDNTTCLLYTSPSPRDLSTSRMPSSA